MDEYQESLVYIQPQWRFKKLVQAYDRAERDGYYRLANVEARSVVILKQPIAGLPAGTKLLWISGESRFHTVGGAFAGYLKCRCDLKFLPVEDVLYGQYLDGIDLKSPCPSENEYIKRFTAVNYAHRLLVAHKER